MGQAFTLETTMNMCNMPTNPLHICGNFLMRLTLNHIRKFSHSKDLWACCRPHIFFVVSSVNHMSPLKFSLQNSHIMNILSPHMIADLGMNKSHL